MWTASREAERKAEEDREIDTGNLICIESRNDLTTTLSLSNNVSLYTTLHNFIFYPLLPLPSARFRRKETFLTIWEYILEQVWNNKVHFPQDTRRRKKGWLCWWTMWRRNLRYLQKSYQTNRQKKSIFFLISRKKALVGLLLVLFQVSCKHCSITCTLAIFNWKFVETSNQYIDHIEFHVIFHVLLEIYGAKTKFMTGNSWFVWEKHARCVTNIFNGRHFLFSIPCLSCIVSAYVAGLNIEQQANLMMMEWKPVN